MSTAARSLKNEMSRNEGHAFKEHLPGAFKEANMTGFFENAVRVPSGLPPGREKIPGVGQKQAGWSMSANLGTVPREPVASCGWKMGFMIISTYATHMRGSLPRRQKASQGERV